MAPSRIPGPALVVALGLLACSVDDRRLAPAGSGAAGPNASDPSAGATGDGNPNAPAPDENVLVDGCADLDTDGVGDCTVTLVQNPSFTADVSGWTAVAGATWIWDPENALDDMPSGSGKLSVETPRGSATQCVPLAWNGEIIIAYTDVFVQPPDDPGSMNQATIGAAFFASGDCSGASSNAFESPPNSELGQWTVIHAGGVPTSPTGSVSVQLNAIKAGTATDATAYFDNVMLRKTPTH